MKQENLPLSVNLQLFDAAGAAGAGAASSGGEGVADAAAGENQAMESRSDAGKRRRANPLENVVYGKQQNQEADVQEVPADNTQDAAETAEDTAPTEDRKAAFEKLIQGEYKDQFAERTQAIIDKRFRETKTLEQQIKQAAPVLDMLCEKYGVPKGDLKKLNAAIEEDDSYYEEEAMRRGMSVEQLKEIRKIERENETLRKEMEEKERRENADRLYSQWLQQSEELKNIYPSFNLQQECQDQRFVDLLRNNIDVRTAYEVIHRDDIIGGAMQYTAQQVSKKLTEKIRTNGARPAENGLASHGAVITKSDVNSWTKADRDEVERRVLRGEKIVL